MPEDDKDIVETTDIADGSDTASKTTFDNGCTKTLDSVGELAVPKKMAEETSGETVAVLLGETCSAPLFDATNPPDCDPSVLEESGSIVPGKELLSRKIYILSDSTGKIISYNLTEGDAYVLMNRGNCGLLPEERVYVWGIEIVPTGDQNMLYVKIESLDDNTVNAKIWIAEGSFIIDIDGKKETMTMNEARIFVTKNEMVDPLHSDPDLNPETTAEDISTTATLGREERSDGCNVAPGVAQHEVWVYLIFAVLLKKLSNRR